ncbi:hypothetical protein [Pseudemcibacter aquimaris]|uniref:hypothetical protein n=1 Tax=Pseudemcibacter aquimaris TaxID=2857064 RepID=UPI002011180F|nr:hypothetical protein [Pseudemcibacter aquimaris]MCC3861670.1 hypothetical protein [Pseudemcibacter aquimaris]WDU58441.1 hypothetical protein KW060_14705 [Pseudemcibacter aquimaris]
MLSVPRIEQNIYEFSLYNQDVRNLVEQGESHRHYDDEWAEQRYVQITATDEKKATVEINRRFPKSNGFVYTSVVKFMD